MVIMSILGIPDEDEPMMLRLTQEYFGSSDAEPMRGRISYVRIGCRFYYTQEYIDGYTREHSMRRLAAERTTYVSSRRGSTGYPSAAER